jgi:hypothetical protein
MGRFSFWDGYPATGGASPPRNAAIETRNVIDVNGIVIDVIFYRQSKKSGIMHPGSGILRSSNGASEKNGRFQAA